MNQVLMWGLFMKNPVGSCYCPFKLKICYVIPTMFEELPPISKYIQDAACVPGWIN
jgi:hypothetical protein